VTAPLAAIAAPLTAPAAFDVPSTGAAAPTDPLASTTGDDAATGAEASEASDGAAVTPAPSTAGTFNTDPSFNRLGSWPMNALGFASKSARDIFSRVARSFEPVIWEAISLSDCPGFTLYCVTGATGADTDTGAEASETADALLAWAVASEETNVPSSTLATLAAISAARRERLRKRSGE
jgi:hypothetical protein